MPYKDPEKRAQFMSEYRTKNRALLAQMERERQSRLKAQDPDAWREYTKEKGRLYRARHSSSEEYKAKQNAASKAYYQKMRDMPEFRANNVAKVREWMAANKVRARATFNAIRRRRKASDVNYRLAESLRNRLYMAIKAGATQGDAVRLLGCSIQELREHIERQFSPGMTWGNWSRHGWHIDHIRPLSSFDLSDPEQARIACHHANLRPLWAAENISKGAKL